MTERPEGCITHNGPLILCDQCVHENGMRMRRRLSKAMGDIVRKHAKAPEGRLNIDAGPLLADLEAELLKELPE